MKNLLRQLSSNICVACFLCINSLCNGAIMYPDFDESMLRKGFGLERTHPEFDLFNHNFYAARNQDLVKFFRSMYYQNIEAAKEDRSSLRIPRIIHQIWLGSPVPEMFRDWMASWMNLSGWEYKLWTEKEISELSLYNKTLYDSSSNFGEKSDIVRLEILAQFGGVYVDVDLECLDSQIFEELHHSFDFYIGFEPLEHGFVYKFNMFKVCNAILAAVPHHPLIQDLIENMKANYMAYKRCCNAVQKTGPSYYTRILCEHELSKAHSNRNMYLPCSFFYPISEPETRYFLQHPEEAVMIGNETAGFHYWFGSWYKDDPFASSITTFKKIYRYTPGEL